MRDHEAEIRARGARLAAVGLADAAYARAFRDELSIRFPLLIDAAREAYRAAALPSATLAHLFRRDFVTAARRVRAAGHRQGRTGAHPFQLGGTFVLGPGDVDRYARPSVTFGDNAPVSEVLAALDR